MKKQVPARIDEELDDLMRDAVWHCRTTISAFVERAIRREVAAVKRRNNGTLPKRARGIKRGRPAG